MGQRGPSFGERAGGDRMDREGVSTWHQVIRTLPGGGQTSDTATPQKKLLESRGQEEGSHVSGFALVFPCPLTAPQVRRPGPYRRTQPQQD